MRLRPPYGASWVAFRSEKSASSENAWDVDLASRAFDFFANRWILSGRLMTDLALLHRLVGAWQTEATHPALPGVVVKGAVTCECGWKESAS